MNTVRSTLLRKNGKGNREREREDNIWEHWEPIVVGIGL